MHHTHKMCKTLNEQISECIYHNRGKLCINCCSSLLNFYINYQSVMYKNYISFKELV